MTPEQFTTWLQGFSEAVDNSPTEKQWAQIKKKLGTVFNKVTPTLEKWGDLETYEPPKWPKDEIIC
jgi:hypothetical protein